MKSISPVQGRISAKQPLNQREFKALEWFDNGRLKVTWKDTTISWFSDCSPESLATDYKSKVSAALVHEATLAYAEFMLRPKTLEERLKQRQAFVHVKYEEKD